VAADRDAEFHAYVTARSPALLRTAYLLTGDRGLGEDLLQTVLAKVYVGWPRIRDKGALDAYVRQAMATTQTSWWRRRWRGERPTGDLPDHARDSVAADPAERDWMWRHLATLPARQRAVLVLRYYEDLSEGEIARVLGCSTGTVKSQASRALAGLRARIAEEAADEHGPDVRETTRSEP
jgi:RNA polymerase sigma-70 factor (sigma-E family)